MRKNGFTLAEVLITMSIVGVIAALTIPTFVANSRNKANASKLAATVSALENAYTTMMAAEAVNDLSDTVYYEKINADKPQDAVAELSKFIKVNSAGGGVCVMKSGAKLTFKKNITDIDESTANAKGYASLGSTAEVEIDVNGDSKPNKWGRDKFFFIVSNNGSLYPAGGDAFTLFVSGAKTWDQSGAYACNASSLTKGCTARLIEKGYQMDY